MVMVRWGGVVWGGGIGGADDGGVLCLSDEKLLLLSEVL